MANIKLTVSDSNGNFIYSVLQTHCSHSSAAGCFQTKMKESLILTKESDPKVTVVKCESGDKYKFEEVV